MGTDFNVKSFFVQLKCFMPVWLVFEKHKKLVALLSGLPLQFLCFQNKLELGSFKAWFKACLLTD